MPRTKRSAVSLRSSCPVAGALDVIGDRWTLLVVRDLFAGKQRFGDFADAGEGIPTNVLADRLARLEDGGLIESTPYQKNPPRYAYALTAKGREVKPVLAALAQWSHRHVPGVKIPAGMAALLGR
ncbi:MAG TPA: helix-turn-helix domain-containing protein [Candidatus Didemnitutus sp.]|nr:helix-turn-helix domain-containing protein [Candidatus Didemnitutus sp.]